MTRKLAERKTLHRLEAELTSLRSHHLYRYPEVGSGFGFSSNDYLGLSHHPAMAAAVHSAVEASDRVASTGSRLLSGHVGAWEKLEEGFSDYLGVETALFFNSGYAANTGLLTAIVRTEDTVFSDAANHASLIDGIRLAGCRKVIFPHLDLDFLEDALRNNDSRDGERFIVVESIFSMDGDCTPIDELVVLAEKYDAGLIVDEAHATGVVGPQGRGLIAASGRSDAIIASIHTCGKALAASGAFVAGSRTLKEYLTNHARPFIYTTGLPPYMAAQVGAGIKLGASAEDARACLSAISERLREGLANAGFDTGRSNTQIVPVLLGTNERALDTAQKMRNEGFEVRAIRTPTVPEGTARLRLSLTADLPPSTIDGLVDAMTRCRRDRDRSR
jgi:8-amino-7-oxononanoate synthase